MREEYCPNGKFSFRAWYGISFLIIKHWFHVPFSSSVDACVPVRHTKKAWTLFVSFEFWGSGRPYLFKIYAKAHAVGASVNRLLLEQIISLKLSRFQNSSWLITLYCGATLYTCLCHYIISILLYYIMLCYVMLCYVMLCVFMLMLPFL